MSQIDVLCEGCGSAALNVSEDDYSTELIGREGVCSSCGDHGHCDLFGDTDEAIRFFPDPAPSPIVYTAAHRYGPIKPVYFSELTLQVAQETERQRAGVRWHIGGIDSVSTATAGDAKAIARWDRKRVAA